MTERLTIRLVLLWSLLLLPFTSSFQSISLVSRTAEDQLTIRVPPCSSSTTNSNPSLNTNKNTNGQTGSLDVIKPDKSFRSTNNGEVSLVSMNILAPSYNSLSIENFKERTEFLERDRKDRVPLAIQMAKQYNADILCLQEVEGGTDELESTLKELLAAPIGNSANVEERLQGYDTFLWSSLLPNRADNVVGNCVAWRSDRHKLVAVDCFKRGMVCQIQEVDKPGNVEAGATFCVANVHLPAKPSNIMGRLKTMSLIIQKMTRYDSPVRHSPLDGLLLVAGDFNCDQNSVTAKLLTTGSSPYGNIKDRNYRANISKASAFTMKHDYRFKDVYEGNRDDVAPVTVSLTGRGPGCMDQLFFAQNDAKKQARQNSRPLNVANGIIKPGRKKNMGKRKVRRQRVAWMLKREIIQSSLPTAVQVESILATVFGPDDKRLEIINNGLPNVKNGFPSDHIPIGALFVPNKNNREMKEEYDTEKTNEKTIVSPKEDPTNTPCEPNKSGTSSNVQKRREVSITSVSTRRRHNLVLGCVAQWLTERGANDIHRDQPLYKLKFAQGAKKLKKKSRAPDLVCRLGNSLIIVEITVSGKPDFVRLSKLEKYEDLEKILQSSPSVQDAGLTVHFPFVILLDEFGGIPKATRQDILELAKLTESSDEKAESDAQRFCNHLQGIFNGI
jgi:endonuclease/exonuclease/phosphatase family metal-dependent hydrolase